MSFVARRFPSGLIVDDDDDASGVTLSPAFDESVEFMDRVSGTPRRLQDDDHKPFVLAVGVDDAVAALCAKAAKDADLGFVRVAHGPAACRRIPEVRPTVVAIAARLWADERNAIAEIAHSIGARVIELPEAAPATWQALVLVRTALGISSSSGASGTSGSFKATA